jgi:glycosyltransferase involved in cell wall biosynthesis
LPSKILEYFACGKCVLSTPLAGTVEILPDESFGIVYSTEDNFVNKLNELLSDEIKLNELGKNGYDYVIKNHDWTILSKKIVEKFKSVM